MKPASVSKILRMFRPVKNIFLAPYPTEDQAGSGMNVDDRKADQDGAILMPHYLFLFATSLVIVEPELLRWSTGSNHHGPRSHQAICLNLRFLSLNPRIATAISLVSLFRLIRSDQSFVRRILGGHLSCSNAGYQFGCPV